VESFRIEGDERSTRFFSEPVQEFLKQAAYLLPRCTQESVTLRFEFSFSGKGSWHPQTFIYYVAPTTYRIVSDQRFMIAD
jgi:hypothetical protein